MKCKRCGGPNVYLKGQSHCADCIDAIEAICSKALDVDLKTYLVPAEDVEVGWTIMVGHIKCKVLKVGWASTPSHLHLKNTRINVKPLNAGKTHPFFGWNRIDFEVPAILRLEVLEG